MMTSEYQIRNTESFQTKDGSSLPSDDNKWVHTDEPVPTGNYWDRHLTHQLRVLLHTEPLLRLLRRDEHRSPELEHYSSLSLALKLLDLIIENTGLEREIDNDKAVNALLPLLEAMDHSAGIDPNIERHKQMARRVLEALCNDEKGRRPFEITYTDFDQGHALERVLVVRLLEERYHINGSIILRLSNEATNLLLHALMFDIEDAQAATEAIIQSQLARGRIHEALSSARLALLQSQILRDKIERILINTQRDLSRVDWKNEVPCILTESLEHIQSRCTVEASIVTAAWERREALPPGSNEMRLLAAIISLVEDCSQCHTELHQRLIGARQVFLNEQERQSFALRPRADLPHLLSDVLEPLFQMKRVDAQKALEAIFPYCLNAQTPHAFSLTQYISRQLQPRREPRPETVPIVQREQIDEGSEKLHYTAEAYNRALTYLRALEEPTRLADLLQLAIDTHESQQTLEIIILSVLRHFDPHDVSVPLLDVEKIDEEQFSIEGFSGNNVLLSNKETSNERR